MKKHPAGLPMGCFLCYSEEKSVMEGMGCKHLHFWFWLPVWAAVMVD